MSWSVMEVIHADLHLNDMKMLSHRKRPLKVPLTDFFGGVAIFQIRSQAGRAFAGTLDLMSRIISIITQEWVRNSAQLM